MNKSHASSGLEQQRRFKMNRDSVRYRHLATLSREQLEDKLFNYDIQEERLNRSQFDESGSYIRDVSMQLRLIMKQRLMIIDILDGRES